MDTGVWADIDKPVSSTDNLLIVFDHYHCISNIPQLLQNRYEPLCIPLVETDTWLIEDIHRSGQTIAEAAYQIDPLAFTATEGVGSASECEVGETNILQTGKS